MLFNTDKSKEEGPLAIIGYERNGEKRLKGIFGPEEAHGIRRMFIIWLREPTKHEKATLHSLIMFEEKKIVIEWY